MKKLLIVVDMQNDFINGTLGTNQAQAIVTNVKAKIDKYVKNGDFVWFTRDTHGENYLDTQEGRNLPVVHCIKGTWGWEIADGLFPVNQKADTIKDKPNFGSLNLADDVYRLIQDMADAGDELKEIELIGLCTDICVVSNAIILKAKLPETQITVDAACCAGVTEESHNAALLTMKMCQVNVVNWKE